MAIIKIVNSTSAKSSSLKGILRYIQDPNKTQDGLLITAKDCLQEQAYEQMMMTKRQFHKTGGRQYIHIIQSFGRGDPLTPQETLEIGRELLDFFEGYEAVVATHTNTDFLHNHIVLNTVHMETGLKWQMSKQDLYKLREFSDELCRAHGLSVIEKGQKGWKHYGEHAGGSWKQQLAYDVMDSLKTAASRVEFLHNLHASGIQADFGKTNILFTAPNGKMCSNAKLMQYGDFRRENIEAHWNRHAQALAYAAKTVGVLDDVVRLFSQEQGEEPSTVYTRLTQEGSGGLTGRALRDWFLEMQNLIEYETAGRRRERERKQEKQERRRMLACLADALEELQQHRQEMYYAEDYSQNSEDMDEWEM